MMKRLIFLFMVLFTVIVCQSQTYIRDGALIRIGEDTVWIKKTGTRLEIYVTDTMLFHAILYGMVTDSVRFPGQLTYITSAGNGFMLGLKGGQLLQIISGIGGYTGFGTNDFGGLQFNNYNSDIMASFHNDTLANAADSAITWSKRAVKEWVTNWLELHGVTGGITGTIADRQMAIGVGTDEIEGFDKYKTTGINVLEITNAAGDTGLLITNPDVDNVYTYGIKVINPNTGEGIEVINSGGGQGIDLVNSSSGIGINITNASGNGIWISQETSGTGLINIIQSGSSGKGIYIKNESSSGTGLDLWNTSTGVLLDIDNDAAGMIFDIDNDAGGTVLDINNLSTGKPIYIHNGATTIFQVESTGTNTIANGTIQSVDDTIRLSDKVKLPQLVATSNDTFDVYIINKVLDTCQTTITPPPSWGLKKWLRPFAIQFLDRRNGELRWRYMTSNSVIINKYKLGDNSIERDKQFVIQIESLYRYIWRTHLFMLFMFLIILHLLIKVYKNHGTI